MWGHEYFISVKNIEILLYAQAQQSLLLLTQGKIYNRFRFFKHISCILWVFKRAISRKLVKIFDCRVASFLKPVPSFWENGHQVFSFSPIKLECMWLHLLFIAIMLSLREKNIEDVTKTVVFLPKMHSLFNIMIYNNWLQQTLILSSWGGILVLALRFYG